jgi:hypothetical protein
MPHRFGQLVRDILSKTATIIYVIIITLLAFLQQITTIIGIGVTIPYLIPMTADGGLQPITFDTIMDSPFLKAVGLLHIMSIFLKRQQRAPLLVVTTVASTLGV